MSPFLAWVDFHARSRFARSIIAEEKWGTTRSLPFYGNYSTLDFHTNIVIFHAFAYSSRWRRKPKEKIIFLSPRRVSPFLAWGDFHARSRFALSTNPEEKWGTTRSLLLYMLFYSQLS